MNLITDHIDIWTAAQTPKANGGRGRSKNSNGQSHGIKKLRELILELAVRGKLVPQDTNDEPARMLLEKIAKEKKQLIKNGKIKKQKPLPEINEDEMPSPLPEGWEFCRFGTLVNSILSGGTPSKRNPQYWNGDIPWASVKDLGKLKYLETTQDHITPKGLNAGSKLAEIDDVIICTRMGLGKIAIAKVKVAINQDLKAVKLTSLLDIDFFLIFFSTLNIKGTGTTVAGIRQEQLLNYVFSLPPLAEQHRIVAKVDELMALCDQLEQQQTDSNATHQALVETLLSGLVRPKPVLRGAQDDRTVHAPRSVRGELAEPPFDPSQNSGLMAQDDRTAHGELAEPQIASHFHTLFTTEHSIDQLKQTILQLAVMGKLVPQDPNDEPAGILLEKIAKEKKQLIKEGKIKKQKQLPEISDNENPFQLPTGWEWSQCQDICYKITDGEHATPRRSDAGHYLLSARNVTNEGILLNDVDFIPLDEFERIRKRCDPNIGDILISCSGSVGRVALVDRDEAYSMVRSAAMIRPDNSLLSKEFVALALRSPFLQEQMVNRSRKTAQANLFLGAISKLVIAIPPLSEQHRIVAKVDELMAVCDDLKARLNAAQTIQIQLADAIVEKAV